MLYPHLYIKSLLEEVKEQNKLMINCNEEYTRRRMSNWHHDDYKHLTKVIEETTLYIEQLNQEIINTTKKMENK